MSPRTPTAALQAVRRDPRNDRSLAERVAAAISDHLSKLSDGAKIPSERDLAQQLEVSRTAIREALRILETAGEIYSVPGQGRFAASSVAGSKWSNMAEWLERHHPEMAGLIEIGAVLQAHVLSCLTSAEARQLALQLRPVYEKAMKFAKADRYRDAGDLDTEFHNTMVSFSRNRAMRELLEHLTGVARDLTSEVYPVPASIERSLTFHGQIVDALAAGDGRSASYILAAHLFASARSGVAPAPTRKAKRSR